MTQHQNTKDGKHTKTEKKKKKALPKEKQNNNYIELSLQKPCNKQNEQSETLCFKRKEKKKRTNLEFCTVQNYPSKVKKK